jgi:uncharacterized membrane protein
MRSRQEIKYIAKQAMVAQRGTAILLGLMVGIIGIASSVIDLVVERTVPILYWPVFWAGMFIIYVAGVNMIGEFIKIYKGEPASAANIFNNMSVNFLRKLGGTLWMMFWVLLWTMLFIIPGIIKGLSYYFTQNILADCPNVTARQALKISMKITNGYKADIFVFILSWIGWYLLSLFTCYILAIVYVMPYHMTADAGLYLELRDKALADGVITAEELGMVDFSQDAYAQQDSNSFN